MGKAEAIEPIIRESIEMAIQNGYLLVCQDYGVEWDNDRGRWRLERTTRAPSCCPIGAYLLNAQPSVDPSAHNGDAYEAAMVALDCTRFWLRDLMNGFDGYEFQGDYPEAYDLGMKLAAIYRPVRIDILELQSPPKSGTFIVADEEEEYELRSSTG